MKPTPPAAPAETPQPMPATRGGPPPTRAAASTTAIPAVAETISTDSTWARRVAAPPRKSALPYSSAAARAKTVTMGTSRYASGRNDALSSTLYRPTEPRDGRRVEADHEAGPDRPHRRARPHPAVAPGRARLVAGSAGQQVGRQQGGARGAGAGTVEPESGHPGPDRRRVRGAGHPPGRGLRRAGRADHGPGTGPGALAGRGGRDRDDHRGDGAAVGRRAMALGAASPREVRR